MQTYHIITIGCQMNIADSERIAGYLENIGLTHTADRDSADLVILTTCGVRQSAEDRIYGLVPLIKNANPRAKILLTGCLVNRSDVKERLESTVDFWLPIIDLPNLAKILNLREPENSDGSNTSYLSLHPIYENNFSAYLPIGNGCNNFCAYCVVPYARGRETYRPAEEIIAEAQALINQGYKEITLIAQNVNSYTSGDYNFPKLLKTVNDITGDFWIRFTTSHPKDLSDELIDVIANSSKVCQHFHIALQSGDDEILRIMNRKYTAEHYLNIVHKIRTAMPSASITTDIIVGFPGETEEQFQHTNDLVREIGFSQIFISQYSPRFGTVSAKMTDDVSHQEKARRENIINETLKTGLAKTNDQFIGQEFNILIDEQDAKYAYGKTATFKLVRVATTENLIGQFIKVKILSHQLFSFTGALA